LPSEKKPGKDVSPEQQSSSTSPRTKKPQTENNSKQSHGGLTRREFVATASILTGGAALEFSRLGATAGHGLGTHTITADVAPQGTAANAVPVILNINGTRHALSLDPRVTLLDALRENLGMTGTKKGCDHGQCGACTVLVNGRRINSCLSLAVTHDGDEIVTVEGLAKGDELDPMQAAFLETDGFQCGYCTAGQICSAVALLREAQDGAASFVTADLRHNGPANLTRDEIRERMSGNICRCGAYPGIVDAVEKVWRRKNGAERSRA
jgi:xanthine dehydrogenase YagT iron-sulfur-binding subunit